MNFLQTGRVGGLKKKTFCRVVSKIHKGRSCIARNPRNLPAGNENNKWKLDAFNILYAKSNSPASSRVAALSSPLMLYLCCFKKHSKHKKTLTTKHCKGRRNWNVVWLILDLRSLRWNFKSATAPEVITWLCARGNAEVWIPAMNPDFKQVSCIFKKHVLFSWCLDYKFPVKHLASLNATWKELCRHSGHIHEPLDLLLTNAEAIE